VCDVDSSAEEVDALCRQLCAEVGLMVLSLRTGAYDAATTALEWTADHARQLGADPETLLVGGIGAGAVVAATLALGARDSGWPALTRQLLVCPDRSLPNGASLAGVAPATVLGALEYASRLREAGVDVEEVARIGDLATSLCRAMNFDRDRGLTNNHDDHEEPERHDC
jgi:acetyl esterase/lipase